MNRRLFLCGTGAAAAGVLLAAATSRISNLAGSGSASPKILSAPGDARTEAVSAKSVTNRTTTLKHKADVVHQFEIVPGLYRLAGLRGANAYLYRPGGAARADDGPVLFDCGYPWSGREIDASLAVLDCRPADIRAIAITHADFDHVGRLAPLAAVSRAEIVAHAAEAPLLKSDHWRTLPGRGKSLDPVILAAGPLYRLWPPQPTQVTRLVQDGEEIGGGWIAVHTPGHTPGHTAYFHRASRTLIAGDALGSVRHGSVRLPKRIFAEDWDAALASVRKLAMLEPAVICFGHGRELHDAMAMLHRLVDTLNT